LGFCEIEISAPGLKFRSGKYPASPRTLGEHIRKRRIDLQLLQKDVASLIGVSEDSITYWENGRSVPQIKYLPKIIEFLGHYPNALNLDTFADRIKTYRYLNGISQKRLGKILGVNSSTICSWENNEFVPDLVNLNRLNKLLQNVNAMQS
jgi:transcriptional regulator with XRE-family HTH domain